MKKLLIALTIIIPVLIIGGFVFYFFGNNDSSDSSNNQNIVDGPPINEYCEGKIESHTFVKGLTVDLCCTEAVIKNCYRFGFDENGMEPTMYEAKFKKMQDEWNVYEEYFPEYGGFCTYQIENGEIAGRFCE